MMDVVKLFDPETRVYVVQAMYDDGYINLETALEKLQGPGALDLTDRLKRNAADAGQIASTAAHGTR